MSTKGEHAIRHAEMKERFQHQRLIRDLNKRGKGIGVSPAEVSEGKEGDCARLPTLFWPARRVGPAAWRILSSRVSQAVDNLENDEVAKTKTSRVCTMDSSCLGRFANSPGLASRRILDSRSVAQVMWSYVRTWWVPDVEIQVNTFWDSSFL